MIYRKPAPEKLDLDETGEDALAIEHETLATIENEAIEGEISFELPCNSSSTDIDEGNISDLSSHHENSDEFSNPDEISVVSITQEKSDIKEDDEAEMVQYLSLAVMAVI